MRRFSPSRYIPAGAVAVNYPAVNAVAYLYEMAGVLYAVCYSGKRNKPDQHYRYQSAEKRLLSIAKWVDGLQASVDFKASRMAEKRAFVHSLKVGDILRSSWGYDQTNIDYYQVVEVRGKAVIIREIGQEVVEDGAAAFSGHCVPVPGKFCGPEMRKMVGQGDHVKVSSCSWASKIEPVAVIAGAKCFAPSYWSAYA